MTNHSLNPICFIMHLSPRFISGLAIAVVGASLPLSLPAQAQDTQTFEVRGSNPSGADGYTGIVEVKKQGGTLAVTWTTGKDRVVTEGFGIMGDNVMGVGYGGAAFYSIAVYEVKGKGLHAKWALTTQPGTVNEYALKGSLDFQGDYRFADGSPGKVTMTPTKGGAYKMSWDLATGHYEGLGVRSGNALVAVSGAPGGNIGVGVYRPKGKAIEGLWTSAGLTGAGTELWTPSGGGSAPNAGTDPAPAPTITNPPKNEPSTEDLTKAISADLKKCGEIGMVFIGHIKSGELDKAAAVMSDRAFQKTTKKDFIASLEKSNKLFGTLQKYTPDKKSVDFGVVDGVMTFTLEADAEYAKANVRETLRFIRNDNTEIEMTGYSRKVKE